MCWQPILHLLCWFQKEITASVLHICFSSAVKLCFSKISSEINRTHGQMIGCVIQIDIKEFGIRRRNGARCDYS